MSDYQQGYDDEDDEQPEPQQRTRTVPRDVFKDMERKAKERDEVQKQLDAANRRLAFADAGINTSDAKLGYFVKGYDGEMTADAIRAAAAEAGFIDAAQPDVSDEELRAHERVSLAAAGASSSSDASESEILEGARRAASTAPSGQEAAAYAAYLASKGVDRMRTTPQQ